MVYKQHTILKEMLLADLHPEVMHGFLDTIAAPKDYNCHTNSKVNGQCMFGGECQTVNVIYKTTVLLDGKYYKGKTPNDLKNRYSKHITGVGNFWSEWKQLNQSVGLESVDVINDAHLISSASAAPAIITTTKETGDTPFRSACFGSRRLRAPV